MEILLIITLLLLSILAIAKGSDFFTDSLVPLSNKLGVSKVFIGVILVSVAVSIPEVSVSLLGRIRGYESLSIGIVLGSILCNIGLMVGLPALSKNMRVSKHMILRDGVFSIVAPILLLAVASNGSVTRLEGIALILVFITYIINVYIQETAVNIETKERDLKEVEMSLKFIGIDFIKLKSPWAAFTIGVFILLLGTEVFITQLINLTEFIGVTQLAAGMTIGALGTSIPNIVSAFQATKKGMTEIAVSSALGSNIFTILVTVGVLASYATLEFNPSVVAVDLPLIIVASVLLFYFMLTKRSVSRLEGLLLLAFYFAGLFLPLLIANQ